MSLYNMLFGKNPNTEVILAILELKENDVQRFRDCGFEEDGIYIYTRTGGGNRTDYPNTKLIKSPYYIRDEDDDFDCTYATYHFKIPDDIQEDVRLFKDVRKNGITGKLVQWLIKTIEREETEDDKWSKIWNEQNRLVQQSKKTDIYETNGYIVVPLDDSSLEVYLKLMEQAGGKQLAYSIMPYTIKVSENVPRWETLNTDKPDLERDMCRVKIDMDWKIDDVLWARWQAKFGKKYPKAIKEIERSVSRVKS